MLNTFHWCRLWSIGFGITWLSISVSWSRKLALLTLGLFLVGGWYSPNYCIDCWSYLDVPDGMFKAAIFCSFWFCCYCLFPVCDKGYSSSPFVSPIFVDIWYESLLNSDESVLVLSSSVFLSQVLVIILISELVLCISLLIRFSLCFSDLAFTVDTLIVWTISWLLCQLLVPCLRFLISAFFLGWYVDFCWFWWFSIESKFSDSLNWSKW